MVGFLAMFDYRRGCLFKYGHDGYVTISIHKVIGCWSFGTHIQTLQTLRTQFLLFVTFFFCESFLASKHGDGTSSKIASFRILKPEDVYSDNSWRTELPKKLMITEQLPEVRAKVELDCRRLCCEEKGRFNAFGYESKPMTFLIEKLGQNIHFHHWF